MKKKIKIGIGAMIVLLCLIVFALIPVEQGSISSPDGKYTAKSYAHAFWNYIPAAPGGGGDKPGWITVYSSDGDKLESHHVDMVSMMQEIEWLPDRAHLKLIGDWEY